MTNPCPRNHVPPHRVVLVGKEPQRPGPVLDLTLGVELHPRGVSTVFSTMRNGWASISSSCIGHLTHVSSAAMNLFHVDARTP
ncbi:hypothetical protein [Kibdelosporangium philippinense]|uniref:hypothetical protein n=1 Tax=Kibdelosporangium philippinense TaxID=211113 RepID=UPI0035576D23